MKKTLIPAVMLLGALAFTGCAANGTAPADPAPAASTEEGPDTTSAPSAAPVNSTPVIDVSDGTLDFAEVADALGSDGYEVIVLVNSYVDFTITGIENYLLFPSMEGERDGGTYTFRTYDPGTGTLNIGFQIRDYIGEDYETPGVEWAVETGYPFEALITFEVED